MQDIEQKIRDAHAAGNIKTAANIALECYGQELFGFIVNCVGHSSDSEDIFSRFCEDFWQGLAGFKWRSSLRTWAYSLARHATWRHLSRSEHHHDRHIPLSQVPEVFEIAEKIRTSTAAYLRTTHKKNIRNIRKQLPMEDQMLLILRVDRDLSWRDIAIVMEGEPLAQDEVALKRTETRLRKRFERVKERLREMAEKEGLL
jgi:RNA polymerase sigma-70 factor (ECF subfamily)